MPEAFAAGYPGPDVRAFGENLDSSPWQAAFARISRETGCMVVVGCLEGDAAGVRNAAVIYDRGERLGVHYKSSLWPDPERPYRDERTLLLPGQGIEVFNTRLGRFAIIICYENMLAANWEGLAGRVDFVLHPYNCQGDPAHNNLREAKRLGIPSAWANRTGTVFAGDGWNSNPGTSRPGGCARQRARQIRPWRGGDCERCVDVRLIAAEEGFGKTCGIIYSPWRNLRGNPAHHEETNVVYARMLPGGCLCYLGCSSLLLICSACWDHADCRALQIAPLLAHDLSPVMALLAINSLPLLGVAIGVVELLQIRAVWQGYRWGVYGLAGIVISEFVRATWGAHSPGAMCSGAMSTAYNNIPLIILFLLVRPKWKDMQ